MSIYFDNSATTKVDSDVLKYMNDFSDEFYANPAALHRFGFEVEEKIKLETEKIAKLIGAEKNEIIWTSGGTESNNMALRGVAEAYKKVGNEIITTKIEHSSVMNTCKYLEECGFKVNYLSTDSEGHISLDELRELITDKTILVSIMLVNNEIGSVQNVEEIGKIIKSKNKNIIFHTDAVQGLGKIKINCKKSYIDLLSASSHKFHGPKGVGLLYKKSDVRIKPLIYGGGQQDNLRSGTLNTVGIVGTVKAIDMIYNDFDNEIKSLYTLRDRLIDRLNDLHDKYNNININTKKTDSFAPHIVSVSFKGIRSEVMLHALEEKGIYVSAGSACSSHSKKKSGTLTSIGLSDEMIDSTIRVSFSKYNVIEEVDKFINEVDTLIPRLKLK